MSEAKFHGVIPAMATPFAADELFDEKRCIEMIDWYLDCGVHGISVAGSASDVVWSDVEGRRLDLGDDPGEIDLSLRR